MLHYVLDHPVRTIFRAADTAGIALPPEVVALRKRAADYDDQIAAVTGKKQLPTVVTLMAGGMSIEDAEREHTKAVAAAATADGRRRDLMLIRNGMEHQFNHAVAKAHPEILAAVNSSLTEVVDAHRDDAALLAPYAPGYDAKAILRSGTDGQRDAFVRCEVGERTFGALMSAARAIWAHATGRGMTETPLCVEGFDERWVDQRHRFWANPAAVRNDALRGDTWYDGRPVAIRPTLLGVCSESPEAGFRMASPAELAGLLKSAVRIRQHPVSGGWQFDVTRGAAEPEVVATPGKRFRAVSS